MIAATTTYLYVDTDANQYYVQGAELIDRGVWDNSAIYQRQHAVEYDGGMFVALQANSGAVPTGFVDENWSALVIIIEGGAPITSAGSDYLARLAASQAQSTAQVGTNVAYTALFTAWAGTDAAAIGGAAAYALAESGTQLARLALQIASEGTNTGTAALGRADYAIELASVGTDAALYALNLASTGTSAAQFAISVAVAGTDAAANAAAIAGDAYSLAMLGTIIPPLSSLPDVSIPTPFVNQVLAFDGSLWVAKDTPSQVAPGAFTLYLENTASGTDGYFNLRATPSGLPEDQDDVSVGGAVPLVYVEGYLTNFIERTSIDGGIWEFNTYSAVSNGAQSAQIVVETYLHALNGSETLLFTGTSAPVSSTSVALSPLIIAQGSFVSNLTDKLLVKYAWLKTSGPSVTTSLWHSGSEHASHIHTPIGYAHNDLGGLQGGTTEQYYHTTLDQQGAMLGTDGYPDATNRFVTDSDPRFVTISAVADLALQIAIAGTDAVVVEAGSRTAADVFEAGTRLAADLELDARLDSIEDILGQGFSGTSSMYVGQVYSGGADIELVVVNGMVTSQVLPYYAWNDFCVGVCTTGSVSSFVGQSGWGGAGTVVVDLLNGTRIAADDFMDAYVVGTITNQGGTISSGTGWASSALIQDNLIRVYGSETFEAYTVGTVYGTGVSGTLDGGFGWAGTIVIWTY